MNNLLNSFAAALIAATALTVVTAASAQTVLRLDEVAVGELDPGKAADYADSILMFNIYDTLVIPNQGAPGYQGHLAESWTIDGTVYTFKMRPGVKFQSGNPVTAEDVVFSLNRSKALGQGLSYLFAVVEKAEAVDASTVKFTLKEASSPFVASLVRLPIIDKKLVMANLGAGDGEMEDWGQAFLAANGAGSGAYKVIAHNPQQETVMSRNADYFLGVSAKAPDTVRLRYGLEAATVRTLIARGEHDISSQWLPPEVLKSIAADGAQLLTESGTAGFYIKMNTTKPPLDDVHCRLALANAFDYASGIRIVAINDTISQGKLSTGAIPQGMLGANPPDMELKRNLDAAKAHLAKCQYKPEDINLELSWIGEVPIEERFALLMQANFAEIGIKSEIWKLPWALFSEQVSKSENTPNISQLFVSSVTSDPDTLLYGMYHSSAKGTWQSPEYLQDADVDTYLEEGRALSDDAGRADAYSALNKRLMEIAPTIYAQDQVSVFAASNRVSVPALSDPAKAFNLSGFGFNFRLMEMTE